MKYKSIFLPLFFALFSVYAFSQELYEPRNIKNAYQNQTRSRNGAPGKNYWQNRGTYNIKIQVAPPNRTVKGSEEIKYVNNSPDTLRQLNFKLIVNHHKPTAPRSRAVTEDYLSLGIHIDGFKQNGISADWGERPNDATDKFVKLNTPLAPGESVKLDIDWHYKLSKQSGREGAITKNTFFIAYFYPRVAVYDDYVGWDRMPHITAQEFYNDFNDYSVEVTVPKNYIVWGTGVLQNPNEVLQKKYADRFEASKKTDEVIHMATPEDLEQKQITVQNETNTWKFKAKNVTDVALAVSDEYKWDASSVKIGNRRVSIQSAYDEPSKDFEQMVDFIRHSLSWFSTNVPGVDYPYPTMTVVRGFADMEYPMMANDSSIPQNPTFTKFVAEHELAHTYFPFYMGTSETRFGFMDEGWATTLEYLIGIEDLGKEQATKNYQNFRVRRWTRNPDISSDLPIIIPTNMLSGAAMGNNEYGKASLAYLALRDLLGPEKFKEVLQGYMKRWHGKHPMPWDFFYSFNDLSGQNLNWFWKSWFFSNDYIDLAIKSVNNKTGGKTRVTLENKGGFPAPVDIEVTYEDGSHQTFHQTPQIWSGNKKEVTVDLKRNKPVQKVDLKGGVFMDAYPADNSWRKNG